MEQSPDAPMRPPHWRATHDGMRLTDSRRHIPVRRLALNIEEGGWPVHMAARPWCDLEQFCRAWKAAIRMHGVPVTPEQVNAAITSATNLRSELVANTNH
jgi:hypothetical protein